MHIYIGHDIKFSQHFKKLAFLQQPMQQEQQWTPDMPVSYFFLTNKLN